MSTERKVSYRKLPNLVSYGELASGANGECGGEGGGEGGCTELPRSGGAVTGGRTAPTRAESLRGGGIEARAEPVGGGGGGS